METAIAVASTGAVVGAVVSSFLKPWADKAASLAQKKIAELWGVDSDLQTLSQNLRLNWSVLEDAEQRQYTDKLVSDWLERFQGAAYDVEDILDELATEDAIRAMKKEGEDVIQLKRTKEEASRDGRRVSGVNLLCCFTGSSSSSFDYENIEMAPSVEAGNQEVPPRIRVKHEMISKARVGHEMASKIKEINQRLEYLEKEKISLGLRNVDSAGQIVHEIALDRVTTSAQEENLFGRKEEKRAIIRALLPSGTCSDQGEGAGGAGGERVLLVPIVGMGGIGKTTLAQMVFNDDKVQKHFSLRKWICVSDNFDASRLIAEIIQDRQKNRSTLEELQMKLRDKLRGVRFLIVLDDVWCEDQIKWQQLWVPLTQGGVAGGRVIVTTRSQKVVKAVYPMSSDTLMRLSDEDCWSIFEKRAFVDGKSESYPSLKTIGWEIVRKLKGIPLAAKLVAGFLGKYLDEGIWRTLLESSIWPLPDGEKDILPILRLSYHHLPPHLKACFAFCAVFPKDYKFDVPKLVRLWMAQGFVQSQGNRRVEDVGNLYFYDLLHRSFFQYQAPAEAYHGEGYYVMHDCIHDLAESVSKSECLRMGEDSELVVNPEKVRHASLREVVHGSEMLQLRKFEKLRTFLNVAAFTWDYQGGESLGLPATFAGGMELVRVLILGKVDVNELPDYIGRLTHLRYLQVHGVKRLPESATRLYNLQTLILDFDSELPKGMSRLVNLRHLSAGPGKVANISGMGRFTCLQELKMFSVQKMKGHGLGELQGMRQLRGALCLVSLENVERKAQAVQANLNDKVHISDLAMVWNVGLKTVSTTLTKDAWKQFGYEEDPSVVKEFRRLAAEGVRAGNERLDEEVLDGLVPPPNLRKLWVVGNCGARLPGWMQKQSMPFSRLTNLRMYSCHWERLPPLGLLCQLKVLGLYRMNKMKRVGLDFYGGEQQGDSAASSVVLFPSLEVLEFDDMPEWEEWEDVHRHHIVFPSLRRLLLDDCPKLSMLPGILISRCENLSSLSISWCPQLHALPDNGLPPSLMKLHIENCPRLEERCRNGGSDWSKIAHIPEVGCVYPA